MTEKKTSSLNHRYEYNEEYQKNYIRRYVFKLNTLHDQELIQFLDQMKNRSAWFKEQLKEEMSHEQ